MNEKVRDVEFRYRQKIGYKWKQMDRKRKKLKVIRKERDREM